MPQMSPMNWIFLFNLMMISLLIYIISLNFLTVKKKKMKKIMKILKKKNFMNKW